MEKCGSSRYMSIETVDSFLRRCQYCQCNLFNKAMLMLLPLLGVGGGLSVWARGAGRGPAVWCSECWQCDSVRAICLQQHPGQRGLAAGAWAGPRHHHRHLRHLRQGEPVQWPGEVAAAEKEKIFCHVECDAIRLTSHTTIRKLKQVDDTFQPCHY